MEYEGIENLNTKIFFGRDRSHQRLKTHRGQIYEETLIFHLDSLKFYIDTNRHSDLCSSIHRHDDHILAACGAL